MKLPKYKDVLKMTDKAKNAVLSGPRAARAKKQAELEMCKLDEKIAVDEAELIEKCSESDINFSSIIELQDKIALSKRKKKQYQEILDQMFGEED